MADEQTDQAPETGKSAEPEITGLASVWDSDYFRRGLETFDQASKETAKKSDAECPECEKEKQAKAAAEAEKAKAGEKTPYKILKVQGKEVPVYSEQELIDMAQMGVDYRQKTQAVAEEKRQVQGEWGKTEFQKTIERFNALAERLESGAPRKTEPEKEPEKPKSVIDEFGIDPELADPYVIKMAEAIQDSREKNSRLEEATQMFLLDKTVGVVQTAITEAAKEFPIDDIKDENGQSLTQSNFIAILKAKLESPENKGVPVPQLARDAVRELHMSQKMTSAAATEKVKGELISEDMSPAEFKEKRPKLCEKVADQAVADYLAAKSSSPPTLKSTGAGVDAKVASKAKGGDTMRDYIDRAFEDEDILKSIIAQ